eukprot:Awhi_evm1s5447
MKVIDVLFCFALAIVASVGVLGSSSGTCRRFFKDNGKDICNQNGFANRRSSSTVCKGKHCSFDECCKNEWKTCRNFFKDKGKSFCTSHGYANRRSSSTKCSSYSENGCGEPNTCCKNYWKTCKDFFASKGKNYCVKNGFKHRRSSSTKCGTKDKGCGSDSTC